MRTRGCSRNLCGERVRELRQMRRPSREQLMAQLQPLGMDSERGVIKRIENGGWAVSDLDAQFFSRVLRTS